MSLLRQRLMFYEHIPNWAKHQLRPLAEKFAYMLMDLTRPVKRDVVAVEGVAALCSPA